MYNNKIGKNPKMWLSCCFLLLAALDGCTGRPVDVSGNKNYPTDYVVNQVLRIKKPVFLKKNFFAMPPGKNGSVPKTLEEYRTKAGASWPDVLGVLDSGTKLRIKRIELDKSFEMGNSIIVQADVLDGQLRGKTADLTFISKEAYQKSPPASILSIDPEFLEVVQ